MEILWSDGPLTSAAIIARLPEETGFSVNPITVRTYLRRLEEKKLVDVDRCPREHLFEAKASQEEILAAEMDRVLGRASKLGAGELLNKFCSSLDLGREEIERLAKLIPEKDSERS